MIVMASGSAGTNQLFPLFDKDEKLNGNFNSDNELVEDLGISPLKNDSESKYAKLQAQKGEGSDNLFGSYVQSNYDNIEISSAAVNTAGADENMKKEFPVDKDGNMNGDIQDKLVAKYKNVKDFEKDVQSGKFNYVSVESLESLRHHISDNQTQTEFPVVKQEGQGKHADVTGKWSEEIEQKVVDSYNNVIDFDKDVASGKFYYVSQESINSARDAIRIKTET